MGLKFDYREKVVIEDRTSKKYFSEIWRILTAHPDSSRHDIGSLDGTLINHYGYMNTSPFEKM